jgi:hypothetical protein
MRKVKTIFCIERKLIKNINHSEMKTFYFSLYRARICKRFRTGLPGWESILELLKRYTNAGSVMRWLSHRKECLAVL